MDMMKTKEQSVAVRVLEGHTGCVYAVALTPDGTQAISTSADKTLRVWDLTTGKPVATLEGHSSEVVGVAVAESPNGIVLVSGSQDKTLSVWNLASGKSVAILEGHSGGVFG